MFDLKNVKKLTALAGLAVLLAACAPATSDPEENDPLESMNRGIFAFNQVADEFVMEPVAKGYRWAVPDPIRTRIGNMSDNLLEPLNMVNAFLQGDFTQGVTTFWRFVLNSTVGIAGMNDVASEFGLKFRREDFGQTFAVWGAGDGPFLMLPILGPSNVRDGVGYVADWYGNPVSYAIDDTSTEVWLAAGRALVQRERLINVIDDVNENSLDPYVTFRSMYRQHRAAQISNTGDGKLSGEKN